MRAQWGKCLAGLTSTGRIVSKTVAAALAAGVAVLITLAFAAPASATYVYETQFGGTGSDIGEFSFPYGIATDSEGNVYVADTENRRIQKFTSSGGYITQWGSAGSGDGQFGEDADPNTGPRGVATDASDNVYVVDSGNNRIQKFDPDGTFITKWGSPGSGDGQFNQPVGVATDSFGNVFVADSGNNRIQKFEPDGTFMTKWGSPGSGDGQFFHPVSVAISQFAVYVVDQGNDRIQGFNFEGVFQATAGTSGSGDGEFSAPEGIATDSFNLYVADSGNNRIQELDPFGSFVTEWGSLGSGDGQFDIMGGVAIDPSVDTTIDSGPTGTISTNQATFTFSGTQIGEVYVVDRQNDRVQKFLSDPNTTPPAKVQCKIDSEPFADCTSPKTFTGLSDGPHTATFRAEDAVGNQDATPATRTFTVDTTPPDTTIDSGPTGTIATNQATFTFSGTPASDTAKVQCKIDSEPFADCTSPKTFTGLSDGPHTATFRAEDAVGNQDATPATRTFTVDTTPPDTTIDSGPTGTIATNQATFTFSGTPASDTAKVQCKIDSEPFADCTSPKTFTGLSDGPHTATFRAEDAVGNQDATPATRTFTVDTTPPDTTIDSGPTGTIATNQATFTFSGTPASDTAKIQCQIDSEPFADCTSPKTFTGLSDGPHTADLQGRGRSRKPGCDPGHPHLHRRHNPTRHHNRLRTDRHHRNRPGHLHLQRHPGLRHRQDPVPDRLRALRRLHDPRRPSPASSTAPTRPRSGPRTQSETRIRPRPPAPSPSTQPHPTPQSTPDPPAPSQPTRPPSPSAAAPASDTAKIQCRIDSEPFADCTSPKTFTGLIRRPPHRRVQGRGRSRKPGPDPGHPHLHRRHNPTRHHNRLRTDRHHRNRPGHLHLQRHPGLRHRQGPVPDRLRALRRLHIPEDLHRPHQTAPTRPSFRAEDAVGNQDPTPATRTFTVDTTPPDTTIDSGPTGTIATNQATFTFSGTPASDTAKVQCQIDSEPFADCTSPKTFTGLSDGPHTATFRAEDAVGNQDATPATRTFTIDTTVDPPVVDPPVDPPVVDPPVDPPVLSILRLSILRMAKPRSARSR